MNVNEAIAAGERMLKEDTASDFRVIVREESLSDYMAGMSSRPAETDGTDPLAGAKALTWALAFCLLFWVPFLFLLLRGVERIGR